MLEQFGTKGRLPRNFNTFDFLGEGVATSAKTLDTATASGLNLRYLKRTMEKYVDAVASFSKPVRRKTAEGFVRLDPAKISDRRVLLGIPDEPLTDEAVAVIQEVIEYGSKRGVKLIPVRVTRSNTLVFPD